tara:strand:- start:1373 stop:2413 length:1041 start_codon:yes stop_codon:yes gene_type:complete
MTTDIIIILAILFLNFFLFRFNNIVAKKLNLYDVPNNKRKLHKYSTPLNGGVFYFLNLTLIFIFDIFFNNFNIVSVFGLSNEVDGILTLLIIFSLLLLGIIDDKISLPPINKSLLSIIIIFIYLLIVSEDTVPSANKIISLRFETLSFTLDLFELSLIFTTLCFVILQIILNMYDGINLQSAAYYSVIIIHLVLVNQTYNFFMFALLTLIYLIYFAINNYKTKIFLGDNGVYIFSFIISLLIIKTYQGNTHSFFVEQILVILFFPVMDMLRLFFTRLFKNKSPLKADRRHLHHILLKEYGLIKCNILLIFPIILSSSLMNLTNINIIIIIIMNLIFYVYLLKSKKK